MIRVAPIAVLVRSCFSSRGQMSPTFTGATIMSKKHYIAFARLAGEFGFNDEVLSALITIFKQDNCRFNERVFRDFVCAVREGEK